MEGGSHACMQAPVETVDHWLGFDPARDVVTPAHVPQDIPADRSKFIWERLMSRDQIEEFVARKHILVFFVGEQGL
eukprot:363062-Chlamydomonas_euryale.AAC.8